MRAVVAMRWRALGGGRGGFPEGSARAAGPVSVIDEGGELVLLAARGFILLAALMHLRRLRDAAEALRGASSRQIRQRPAEPNELACAAQCHMSACTFSTRRPAE